jgi:hypothetical protein
VAPTVAALADPVGERRGGEYTAWRGWARDKDVLSTGSSVASETQQDPNLPRRASNDPSHIVAKLIEDCGSVFYALGYPIRPTDLNGYAQFVAGFVDKNTQLREAEEWGQEQLSLDILGPNALAQLAAADLERVKHFGSLVSLAEDAYDVKSCLNQDRITHWCRSMLQQRKHIFHTDEKPRLIMVDNQPVNWVSFEEDIGRLELLADPGVEIYTPVDFTPCSNTGPWSVGHQTAPTAVIAHAIKAQRDGLGVFLNREAVEFLRSSTTLNLMPCGVAPKHGKKSGRFTTNCSAAAVRSNHPLNSEWVSDECKRKLGEINNPDIVHIIQAIVRASERWDRESLVVWKTDLKGAFNLLHFRPEDVHLMCTEVSSDVIFCYLRGNFGWTGMPFNFEVLTRVLRVLGSASINGEGFMYVDDYIGIGRRAYRHHLKGGTEDVGSWLQDRGRVIRIMVGLLGDDAEAKDKREDSDHPPDGVPGEYWDSDGPVRRHISVLGWEIDLSAWTVYVAGKNRVRAIHAFGSFDPKRHHSRKTYETLCSYAERYSKVYRGLAPLMHHLYEMLSGWPAKARHQRIPSADFRIASKLWLAYMLLSEAQAATNATHGRSLDSFRPRTDKVIIEFDGSLKGIGARVIRPRGDDAQETVIAACASHFPTFDLGEDSSYQNGVELLALAAGLALAIKTGLSGYEVHLRGDSMTVLSWVSSGRDGAASILAYPAMMIVVALAEHWDMAFDSNFTHLTSDQNEICDRLSRGQEVPTASTGVGPLRTPSPGSTLWDLVALGQPGVELGNVEDVLRRWQKSAFRDMQQNTF